MKERKEIRRIMRREWIKKRQRIRVTGIENASMVTNGWRRDELN